MIRAHASDWLGGAIAVLVVGLTGCLGSPPTNLSPAEDSGLDGAEGPDGGVPPLDATATDTGAGLPEAAVRDGGGDAAQRDGGGKPPDSGSDAAACANVCTAGQVRCATGSVQTCTLEGHCTQWATTTTCGSNQTCMATANSASCTCNASLCTQSGKVCQDSQTIATCAVDANSCLYPASTTACTAPQVCSGMAPSAACSATCSNTCTQGQTSCVSGGLATCTLGSDGCWSYAAPVGCATHESCTGAAGTAKCTCNTDSVCKAQGNACQDGQTVAICASDANSCVYLASTMSCTAPQVCSGTAPSAACALTCTNSCTQGQKSCVSGGLATCTLGSNGCWAYGAGASCATRESCTGAAGSASCACNADSVCKQAGKTCQDGQTVATCGTDSNSCLYVTSTTSCTAPESCAGTAPSASCSLTCTNSCTQGQTACISGGEATCTLGSNGCWAYGTSVSACGTHQTCTGAAGVGKCTCNTDPVCYAAGNLCASTSTLATCAEDAQGCFYQSTSKTCSNGACSAGACCSNACTNGAAQCPANSSTEIETCTVGSNGCTAWTTPACTTGLVCERYGGAACVNPSWAEWPMPTTSGPFTDNGDGTVTDDTTQLVWQQSLNNTSTQSAAVATCATLSLGGYTDWRLPSVVELLSIFDPTLEMPAINQTYFPQGATFLQLLWSSTLVAGFWGRAACQWVIDFYIPGPASNARHQYHSLLLRAVRVRMKREETP